MGIQQTGDLGKYLGIPLIHGRVSKHAYDGLVDRIQHKLAGWKSRHLNLAGRLTLIQSVTSAIPIHTMHTALLPASTCSKIDSLNRRFLWGGNEGVRKLHLVNWDTVCNPKAIGGLGIKSIREHNLAMLAKAAWVLISNPSSHLWSKFIIDKYGRNGVVDLDERKSVCSSTWRGIQKAAAVLDLGIGWRIGTGEQVDFWQDIWLDNSSVADLVRDEYVPMTTRTVSSVIDENGQWNRELISSLVPLAMAQKIFGVVLPSIQRKDTIIWKLSKTGHYTPKSGYEALMKFNLIKEEGFVRLWRIPGPAKWLSLLWLARRNRLHSLQLRQLRGLTTDAICTICNNEEEDSLHILRECSVAKSVWRCFVPEAVYLGWSNVGLVDWIDANLHSATSHLKLPWAIIFAATIWYIWRWRCQTLFDEEFNFPRWPESVILADVRDVCRLWRLEADEIKKVELKQIAWEPPEDGWVKVNSDGASKGNPGPAGFGGLIRDCLGHWLVGYSGNLGTCSSMVAELEGIRRGLELAWAEGHRKVWLEADSLSSIQCLEANIDRQDVVGMMVHEIQLIMKREWIVRPNHRYREGNQCADFLANCGIEDNEHFKLHRTPPVNLQRLLWEDERGTAYPREAVCPA